VDDEPKALEALRRVLEPCSSLELETFASWSAAEKTMSRDLPSLLLLDIIMPGTGGMEALRIVRSRWPRLPVVMTTGVDDLATAVECMKLGASDYLVKPLAADKLMACLRSVLLLNDLATHRTALRQQPARASETLYELSDKVLRFHPDRLLEHGAREVAQPVEMRKLAEQLGRPSVYSDPAISLQEVARALGTNTSYLSRSINAHFGVNFRTLVNLIRFAVMIERIETIGIERISLEGLAATVGFSRPATFYNACKALLGKTPGQFFKPPT